MSKFLEQMLNKYIVLMIKQQDLTQDGERAAVKGYLRDECDMFYWLADSLDNETPYEFIAKESVCLIQPYPSDVEEEEVDFGFEGFDSDDGEDGMFH